MNAAISQIRTLCGAGLALLLITTWSDRASAADEREVYPNKAVKIIVPLPPGPVADVLPRILAEKLSIRWKQPVIVENRVGAASNIGAEAVAKAEPDGHTLLATPQGPLAISRHFFPRLGFDPSTFVPVSVLATVPFGIVVASSSQIETLDQLIDRAKANPGKVTFGSAGVGSPPHLGMARLAYMAGVSLTHVPYPGLAPAQRDLLAGHIDVMVDALGNALPLVKDKKLRLLATTGVRRLAEVPDVPTAGETYPGITHQDWFAVVAPPGTPAFIAQRVSEAISDVLKQPDVSRRAGEFFVTFVGSSPSDTAVFIRDESARWREFISAAHLRAE